MKLALVSAIGGLAFLAASARADEAALPLFCLPAPTLMGYEGGPPSPALSGIWNAPSSSSCHVTAGVGFGPCWVPATTAVYTTTIVPVNPNAPRTGIVDTVAPKGSSSTPTGVLPGSRRP